MNHVYLDVLVTTLSNELDTEIFHEGDALNEKLLLTRREDESDCFDYLHFCLAFSVFFSRLIVKWFLQCLQYTM